MSLSAYLASYSTRLDDFLRVYFKQLKKDSASVHPHLGQYINRLEDFVSRGKRIRGALTLLGYQLAGGKGYQNIIPITAAIELLHSALLIHDDFIDNDNLRRGQPTIHKYYGKTDPHLGDSLAILLGDTGIFAVQQLFAASKFPATKIKAALYALNTSLIRTCYGQILDVTLNAASEDELNDVYTYKTGYYTFVNPLAVGIILAKATPKRLAAIEKYGLCVAQAFQHRDDILGTFGDPKITGKSNTSDILTGKKTMLYFKTLQQASGTDLEFFKKHYGKPKLTTDQLAQLRKIIQDSGALTQTQEHIQKNVEKATIVASEITSRAKYQKLLSELAVFVATRNK